MARSYRKPYDYNCYRNPGADKRRGRRRLRRIVRTVIHTGVDPDGDIYPTRDEVDNPWNWGVDGKPRYVGNIARYVGKMECEMERASYLMECEAYIEKVTRK